MLKKIKVLTFSGYYLPGYKGGGPIKTIKNLFLHTSDAVNYKLVTSDRDLDDTTPYDKIRCNEWNELSNVSVFYSSPNFTGLKSIARVLLEKDYELIYLNSFFSIKFSFFPLIIAKILGKKIILGPRGEFSLGALGIKSSKKKCFLFIYKLLGLHKKVVFQASTVFEANDIRRVLGNDADVIIAEDIGSQEFSENMVPRQAAMLKAVFISRISPKKNLHVALDILKQVKQPLEYHIYGPIEDEVYWQRCMKIIEGLPAHITVKHMGSLMPDEVVLTLNQYDVFFFPTAGENYGHVIAEALCAGLPILVSDATPWRNLEQKSIGWDLPLSNLDEFSAILDYLAAMSSEEHLEMRYKVLEWSKFKFSQRDAIEANVTMFEYACNKN
ncbi:putative glycosyltransferase [Vibrio cholerae]|nr:putative glycosyltransferase [Vibrio cholerae]GIC34069.1 putative glycosyltransferase [Vibrio cholerae]